MRALEKVIPAKGIGRMMLRGGHEPGAWVVWGARLWPLFEGRDESVLRELLGKANVAHDPREASDDPGGLNPPDCIDGAMGIGRRHGYPSHHLQFAGAIPKRPRLLPCGDRSAAMPRARSPPDRTSGESRSRLPIPASVACEVP